MRQPGPGLGRRAGWDRESSRAASAHDAKPIGGASVDVFWSADRMELVLGAVSEDSAVWLGCLQLVVLACERSQCATVEQVSDDGAERVAFARARGEHSRELRLHDEHALVLNPLIYNDILVIGDAPVVTLDRALFDNG